MNPLRPGIVLRAVSRALRWSLLALLLLGSPAQPASCSPDPEGAGIYDLCLREAARSRGLRTCLLQAQTLELSAFDQSAVKKRLCRAPALWTSFLEATRVSSSIPRFLAVEEVSLEELARLRPAGSGPDEFWVNLHREHPGKSTLIRFSGIGFDAGRTTALVYVTISSGSFARRSCAWVLGKRSGRWTLRKRVIVFLS